MMKDNISEIAAKLADINQLIKPYQLAYVSPGEDCVALEKNAHYMDKETLDRLTHNIAADGFLSQLPFAMKRKDDGRYLILSGNHRLKASLKAGLSHILILYIDEVDKNTQIAYQLSHNALVGKDDMRLLRDIYHEMETLEAQEFSGLNGMQFLDIEKITTQTINDSEMELTEMKFYFIEDKANEVKRVLKELEQLKIDEDSSIVVGDFEAFIKTMTEVKKVYGIKSNSIAFAKMIQLCDEVVREQGGE
ncbi:MAG: ParB N-terminal domain-containing protein [Chlorobiaceae bacterium]